MSTKANHKLLYLAIGTAMVGIGIVAFPVVARRVSGLPGSGSNSADSAPDYTGRTATGDESSGGRTVTIAKPRAELFKYWRDFSNLPRFMNGVDTVDQTSCDATQSTWFISANAGGVHTAEITISEEVENELIAWQSASDADSGCSGRVSFEDAPGNRGTRVSLVMATQPRGGLLRQSMAHLTGPSSELQARHDLKRFKMLMETGEITTAARVVSHRNTGNHANHDRNQK